MIATLTAIACSLVPDSSDPHPLTTFLKVVISTAVMLGIGLLLFWQGNRGRGRGAQPADRR